MAREFARRLGRFRRALVTGWRVFQRNTLAIIGFCILLFFLALAVVSPFYSARAPMYEPLTGYDPAILGSHPPSLKHPLGTDFLGRDILSQIMKGSQLAFAVGIIAALTSVVIGTLIGLISGYFGGLIDSVLMRMTDIVLTLPSIPLLIIIGAAIGKQSIWIIVVIIGALGWPSTARVVRSQTLSLKMRPFVDAARVAGSGHCRVVLHHIAPNVLPLAFLYMTFLVTWAILTEAGLSFIGLGDSSQVSWGMMLQWCFTSGHTFRAWYWILPPGLSISLLTLAFYLIGRGLDEVVNPRLQER